MIHLAQYRQATSSQPTCAAQIRKIRATSHQYDTMLPQYTMAISFQATTWHYAAFLAWLTSGKWWKSSLKAKINKETFWLKLKEEMQECTKNIFIKHGMKMIWTAEKQFLRWRYDRRSGNQQSKQSSSSLRVSFHSRVKMNTKNWPAPNVWVFIASPAGSKWRNPPLS